jgi:hypothetical protein
MSAYHCRDGCARKTAPSIAAPHDAAPRYDAAQAILTEFAVPEEDGITTEQTMIVQRLHNRYAFLASGVKGRRRNKRKRIVKMRNVRLDVTKELAKLGIVPPAPNRPGRKRDTRHSINRVVRDRVRDDIMSMRPQHRYLGRQTTVFSTSLLIKIMDNNDAEPFKPLSRDANARMLRAQDGERVHDGTTGGLEAASLRFTTECEAEDGDTRQTSPFDSAGAWSACSAKKRMRSSSRRQPRLSSISQECAHR